MADDPRARRVASNEGAFREVNERVEELAAGLEQSPELVCECGRIDCAERLRVPMDEYERVRAHGRRFVVIAGHEEPEFERVVEEREGWLVVEKTGEAGEIADDEDPREP